MASVYQNVTFYLPVFMDFRGRIYTEVTYLSYQGHDLIRSLIIFKNEEQLNEVGINYLKLYIVNTYKGNKMTYKQRCVWFDDNINDFISLYLKNSKAFLHSIVPLAKEPFQFLSAFLEYLHISQSKGRVSGFPILFDCTCSGIQHLSAMCADLNLAQMVNVISSEDQRSDIYQIATEYVINKLSSSDNPKINEFKHLFSNIEITRSLMKIPIMTIPYNISLDGVTDKITKTIIKNKFYENNMYHYEIDPEFLIDKSYPIVLSSKGFGTFCVTIYKSLYEIAPVILPLIEYFNSMAKILSLLGMPIIWVTPSNMTIKLSSIQFESKVSKIKLNKISKPITVSIPTNNIDVKANVRGFVANLIHSMDASHINLIIKNLPKTGIKIPLYTIHDCFATTPNKMALLNSIILSSFVEQYFNKNYIESLHVNLVAQIVSFIGEKNMCTINGEPHFIDLNNKIVKIPQIPEQILQN